MGETVPFKRNDVDAALSDDRIYSNEEVSEIIGIALRNAQDGAGTTVNHEEMRSIAAEFGLGGGDIQRALDTLAEKQQERELADQAGLAFKLHAATFVVINAGLLLINLLASPNDAWFLYPLICWGVVVALHGIAVKYAPAAPWLLLEPLAKHYGMHGAYAGPLNGRNRAAFYIDDVYGALAKANGIVELTDDALVLEYEISDKIFGAIKSKVREEIVPYEEIMGVHLQRCMWNAKLTLQGRRLSTFADVPSAKGGEATLTFKREHRNAAAHLAQALQARCAQTN